jgi:hypothetical protein
MENCEDCKKLREEVAQLDYLYKLNHSLADQWKKERDAFRKDNDALRDRLRRMVDRLNTIASTTAREDQWVRAMERIIGREGEA